MSFWHWLPDMKMLRMECPELFMVSTICLVCWAMNSIVT